MIGRKRAGTSAPAASLAAQTINKHSSLAVETELIRGLILSILRLALPEIGFHLGILAGPFFIKMII